MTKEEHLRELRVLDQCISMYWSIAETKKRKALWLSVGLLFSSVVLCGLTFIDATTLAEIGFVPKYAKIAIGLASVAIFGLSIIELRVDWSGTARVNADAAKRLSRLKSKYRQARELRADQEQQTWLALSNEYTETFEHLPEIPNTQFAMLKSQHLFKVELSKELDKFPRVPAFIVAYKLRVTGLIGMFRADSRKPVNEPPSYG